MNSWCRISSRKYWEFDILPVPSLKCKLLNDYTKKVSSGGFTSLSKLKSWYSFDKSCIKLLLFDLCIYIYIYIMMLLVSQIWTFKWQVFCA